MLSSALPLKVLSSVENYDGSARLLTQGTLNQARASAAGAKLLSGQILVAGGVDPAVPGAVLSSAEIYDPSTGTSTATATLNLRRYFHAAASLPDGNVLMLGGVVNGRPSDTAELYRIPRLVFTTQPLDATSGTALAPAVTISLQDAFGSTASNPVTIALGTNPGGATLSGTTTATPVNGVVTFSDLSLDKAGIGYTLDVSSAGFTGATSTAFNVSAGTPARVSITTQPSDATAGTAIAPAVTIALEDAFGNRATTATNAVTVALGANPGGATLSGTTTVSAVNGAATFSDLSLDKAGTGYTLATSSVGLSGATSVAFNVTCTAPNAPTALVGSATGSTLSLSWNAPTGSCAPTSYVVESGTAPGLANLANFDTGNALTSFTASSVSNGVYYIRVRAHNAAGVSAPSNEVLVTVP
jgi:hypothetical protein